MIKEFGLHSKNYVAPKEGLVPAEACSHESFRELQEPEGVDGKTGLGGAGRGGGLIRCAVRCPGLEGTGPMRGRESSRVTPVWPADLRTVSVAPFPIPHTPVASR